MNLSSKGKYYLQLRFKDPFLVFFKYMEVNSANRC